MLFSIFLISIVSWLFLTALYNYKIRLNVSEWRNLSILKRLFYIFFPYNKFLVKKRIDSATEKQIKYVKALRYVTAPVLMSTGVILIIQLWLNSSSNIELATASILELEKIRDQIYNNISFFKRIKAWDFFGATLILGVVTLFSFTGFFWAVKKYNKILSIIKYGFTILTLLSCFSFFGGIELDHAVNLQNKEKRKIVAQLRLNKDLLFVNYQNLIQVYDNVVLDIVLNNLQDENFLKDQSADFSRERKLLDESLSNDEQILSKLRNKYRKILNSKLISYDSLYNINSVVRHLTKKLVNGYNKTLLQEELIGPYIPKSETKFNDKPSFEKVVLLDQGSSFSRFLVNNSTSIQEYSEESIAKQQKKIEKKLFEQNQGIAQKIEKLRLKKELQPILQKGTRFAISESLRPVLKFVANDNIVAEILLKSILNLFIENEIAVKIDKKVSSFFLHNKNINVSNLIDEKALGNNKIETEKIINKYNSNKNRAEKEISNGFRNLRTEYLKKEQRLLHQKRLKDLDDERKRHQENLKKNEEKRKRLQQIARIEESTKFELSRKRFRNHPDFYKLYADQRLIFTGFHNDWEKYKNDNFSHWLTITDFDLEKEFLRWLEMDDGARKACWGFILQTMHLMDAVEFYYSHPIGLRISKELDGKVPGKPYYMLAYYLGTVAKERDIDDFYDWDTDNYVSLLCPPDY